MLDYLITWDDLGTHRFQSGVDRGVLYIGESAVAWNGLVSVDETPVQDSNNYYLDGVKYLISQTPSEYTASLKAYTYPNEFEAALGNHEFGDGFFIHEQPPKPFGLSYRTRIGDDVEGVDLGYKIHLVYNVIATPDTLSFQTLGDSVEPSTLSWTISGVPVSAGAHRPSSHVSIDTTRMDPALVEFLEGILYGTEGLPAHLPLIEDILSFLDSAEGIFITDHGDGTWSASGPDEAVSMTGPDTFSITSPAATFIDPDTFTISTSEPT